MSSRRILPTDRNCQRQSDHVNSLLAGESRSVLILRNRTELEHSGVESYTFINICGETVCLFQIICVIINLSLSICGTLVRGGTWFDRSNWKLLVICYTEFPHCTLLWHSCGEILWNNQKFLNISNNKFDCWSDCFVVTYHKVIRSDKNRVKVLSLKYVNKCVVFIKILFLCLNLTWR